MAGAKRLPQLAKKWQRVEALGRKRLSVSQRRSRLLRFCTSQGSLCHVHDRREASRGTVTVPQHICLQRAPQEEFGFATDGKITLPCDAAVMEYAMCLLRRNASVEVESALLSSVVMSCHYMGCVMPTVGASQQICCL